MRKRIQWIDVAKGIGIFLIVLGHTLQGRGFLRQFTYAFSVPLFFILVGFTYRYNGNRKSFYKDKFIRILIPYFTFAVISIFIFSVLGKAASSVSNNFATTAIFPNLIGMVYGNARTGYMKWNSPLWFLTCLFSTYVLVENFEHDLINQKKQRKIRVIGIAVSLCSSFVIGTWLKFMKLPFQLETAILMFSYVEMGILAKHYLDKNVDKHVKKALLGIVAVCLLGIGILISIFNGYTDVATSIFGKSIALYMLGSLLLSFSIIIFSQMINTNKILELLGRNTLPILLMHKFPILFFQVFVPVTKEYLLEDGGGTQVAVALAVTVAVLFMCLIVYKLMKPIVPWAFGDLKKQKAV